MNNSNHTLRFPRTAREAGLDLHREPERAPGWMACVGWACVGAMAMWLWFAVVLGVAP